MATKYQHILTILYNGIKKRQRQTKKILRVKLSLSQAACRLVFKVSNFINSYALVLKGEIRIVK